MQKIRFMVMVMAGLMAAGGGRAQDSTHYFTLQQALEYGQQHNVQVKNALLDIKLQEQVNREVTGSAYPQISASGDLTYNIKLMNSAVPAEFFGGEAGSFVRIPFGVKWTSSGGFALNQILFDGQVFTGLQARKTLIEYNEKNVEVTQEAIRQNIAKVYYQLVVGKTQIDLLDSNIALLEKNKHDTKVMYDNGFAEKLDIDKLDVQLANLGSQKAGVVNQIVNGYLGLKVLIGMPVKENLVLTDTLTDESLKEGILEATEFNYGQRKDFQLAEMGVKLNEYDVQRYKRSKIPTLMLNGYFNEMAQSNQFDLYGSHSYWSPVSALTVKLNIPIFTGGATNARIAQAKIRLQQTQNQLEALKINIDNERQAAQNTFKSAITDMDYQKQNMALAENVYQQTKKKYEMGTGSQIEIDNARVQLQTAQTNYYNALYNAVVAKVDFLKAVGKF
ncbi:TolC family protein [Niabella aurantiaca]|uniref:TolC family protein n=1 Tax=Niabella aurantiaca TaxID=379900 RepID=UPI000381971F|nr:TolC family protein [Niabella aurantiaca]